MGRINLLPTEGNYYKANLHAHSTYSDGKLTPQEMKELYQKHGYHIIAYTDHNVLNYFNELDDENFLALCGFEVDAFTPKSYGGFPKTCHINAIARNPEKAILVSRPEYTVEAINHTIQALVDNDFIVNYNHPCWSAEEPQDYLALKNLSGMEIYNHGCEVVTNDGDSRGHYDIMLKHGMKLYCLATDDNHNVEVSSDIQKETDSCGGYVMIKAKSLTYDSVISALDKGEFYSSMGPEIYQLYIENHQLILDCSPVKRVVVKCNTIGAASNFYCCSKYDDITHVEFDLNSLRGDEIFLRLELCDSKRKMAFTNPYYL